MAEPLVAAPVICGIGSRFGGTGLMRDMYNMFNMHDEEGEQVVDGPDGRKFYGSVTVGERGQIVIPAQARRDHGMTAGDKLIVLGNNEGIAIVGVEKLMQVLGASSTLLETLRKNSEEGR